MPPLPVIADVYRVSLDWIGAGGVTPRNSLHFRTAFTDLDEIGAAFNLGWQTARATAEPLFAMSSDFECFDVDVLPLDGTTASHTVRLEAEIQGNTEGEWSPATAVVASLHTTQRGARGRGRMYIGPIAESKMENGLLVTASVIEMQSGWEALLDQFQTAVTGLQLVIASYVHADAHDVTSVRVDSILGTQRRRQDQLR